MDKASVTVIVTGEHENLSSRCPTTSDGARIEWISVPVLRFERLSIAPELMERLTQKPVDWIVFTSQRSVHFWTEALLEYGVDFPAETQVACIGDQTADAAGRDGYTADFYPSEPGTEAFLEEFDNIITSSPVKPSVFIPMAEGGRTGIRDRLRERGCEVISASLYRTLPREDLGRLLSKEQLEKASLILFTSPSSFDAFTRAFTVPSHVRVASLGRFTARHLEQKGFTDQRMLPEGDFGRIGELLAGENEVSS